MSDAAADEATRVVATARDRFGLTLEAPVLRRHGRASVVFARSDIGNLYLKQFGDEAREHFRHERAGLTLLGGLDEAQPFVPRLIASDEKSLMLVLAAVSGPALADVLDAPNRAEATRALVATAGRLGRLHGRARGAVAKFDVGALSGMSPGKVLTDGKDRALAFCERALGPDFDRCGIGAALTAVAESVDRPGALLTVTVGDMAPSNVLLASHGPVFVDLEYCRPRHAFYDAMFWHAICVFPAEVAAAMDAAYRDALETTGLALDGEAMARGLVLLMSHRLFWTLSWGMVALFEADREFAPGAGSRAVIRGYLANFVRLVTAHPGLVPPALEQAGWQLDRRLGELWPDAAGGAAFPCFAGSASL